MRVLVIFVEPMLYGMDLIQEVYEKTEYTYQYIYCNNKLTGRDELDLPKNSFICNGNKKEKKQQVIHCFQTFQPEFAIINGYVGIEQVTAIKYCQKNKIPYTIESDTPLHIPSNKSKAFVKKIYLHKLLKNKYCYGFPGGTLQKENFLYYGIPEDKCFVMPMSVKENRIIEAKNGILDVEALKIKYGVEGKKVVLFVGRLERVKNVDVLLRAFKIIKEKNKELALFIIGDGTEKAYLERRATELQISDIYFEGYITFPKNVEYYKMADVFVLPSTYEPWGLVINEAIIMDLPVVISSHVGCRNDLVRQGENGFIFEDNDEKDLAKNIEKALVLEIKDRVTDEWNYKKYLKQFITAVESICKE